MRISCPFAGVCRGVADVCLCVCMCVCRFVVVLLSSRRPPELAAAGLKLSAELSRLGVNYKTKQGENMARLGQQLSEVSESSRSVMICDVL